MAKYTPMMEQYLKIKEENKDCILFFRLGDFYEMFFDDALTASKELEITLTGKDCGMPERAPMCGVPFHSAESYITRLVEKGYKVAICEQVEDPAKAKAIVKREVIRIVTPGTLTDSGAISENLNNYIACIYSDKKGYGFAYADVTTGEMNTTSFGSEEESKLIDEAGRLNPAEIISNVDGDLADRFLRVFNIRINVYSRWAFDLEACEKVLNEHFHTFNLNGFGLENENLCVCAAGALMEYLSETQKNNLSHISSIKKYNTESYMVLDLSSRRNLELCETIREKNKKGSLLWVLDMTKTAMGARLLRKWIERPLINVEKINKRLDAVSKVKSAPLEREELKEYLNTVYDIERLLSKVVYKSANAKDLLSLKASFVNLPYIKGTLLNFDAPMIKKICGDFDVLSDVYELIDRGIKDDAPVSLREGGLIKEGYNEDIDKYNEAKNKGTQWLAEFEAREKEQTGIKNLRVRYNKVFGYFIEVINSNLSKVPESYIRKQTLSNCERFITPELKNIEDAILGANEKLAELEYEVFSEIRDKISSQIERIQKTAYYIALTDVLQSLAEAADKYNYVRPEVNSQGNIKIINSRHPVVERTTKSGFIPNDIDINMEDKRVAVITGPNMAGKSTYMRQAALLVLMAQIGSFIPADSAVIGVADRIFTRVGASDDLATGQSTFMVEMNEVANILNNATNKSLLILDEIGRGTSTFDGLSIAWAVLEHIADKSKLGARTLFATHYHELTDIEGKVEGVKNYTVAVEEKDSEVLFLRKIKEGKSDQSYGIYVAKLAGIPKSVLERANDILGVLVEESGYEDQKIVFPCTGSKVVPPKSVKPEEQGQFFYSEDNILSNQIEVYVKRKGDKI